VVDALSLPNALEDPRFFVVAVGGDEHGHGLADRFCRRVAEHALGTAVPGGSAPPFQVVMMPVRSLLMMASSEDSTMAASRACAMPSFCTSSGPGDFALPSSLVFGT
jgi:hypothetical protein